MSDFCKCAVTATYSEDANHNDPEWVTNLADYELTPDEGFYGKMEIDTALTTIGGLPFATLALMIVKNTDPPTGNKITLNWTDQDANANSQKIPPGGIAVIPDVDPTAANITAQATTAAVTIQFVLVGS